MSHFKGMVVFCVLSYKVMSYSFYTASANKVAILRSVDPVHTLCSLHCITVTIQETEGRVRTAGRIFGSPGLVFN